MNTKKEFPNLPRLGNFRDEEPTVTTARVPMRELVANGGRDTIPVPAPEGCSA